MVTSDSIWERRIAVLASFHFVRKGEFGDTLKLAEQLLRDREDLIHKAVGWMLREIGNRDRSVLDRLLVRNYKMMPRTMLRYAIEKHDVAERQRYLRGEVSSLNT
jgi:3-methyladenine DNA glycosylase AlkD